MSKKGATDCPSTVRENGSSGQLCLKTFSGVFIVDGRIRRIQFQATDLRDATEVATNWGVGVEGEVATTPPAEPPIAYDVKKARVMLGGVSRTQIHIWLTTGRLERVPDTRRLLITRESILAMGGERN